MSVFLHFTILLHRCFFFFFYLSACNEGKVDKGGPFFSVLVVNKFNNGICDVNDNINKKNMKCNDA